MSSKPKKPRRPWDVYRHIAVWLGFLMPIAVLAYPLITGVQLFSGPVTNGSTNLAVGLLVYPALLSGAASGSRFFALYAGYAERDAPTAELSASDAQRGSTAAFSPIGDWLWGGLVAGSSGALVIVVNVAPMQEHDPLEAAILGVFLYPMVAFTVALGWILGALIGTGISVFLSTVLGILFGLKHRKDKRGSVTWAVISVFLLLLLITAVGAFGVQIPGGPSGYWDLRPFEVLAGLSVPGGDFAWGPVVLIICRIAFWGAALVFIVLIAIGTPHLLERRRAAQGSQPAGA